MEWAEGHLLTLRTPLEAAAPNLRTATVTGGQSWNLLTIATQDPHSADPRRRFQPVAILGDRGRGLLAGITA